LLLHLVVDDQGQDAVDADSSSTCAQCEDASCTLRARIEAASLVMKRQTFCQAD
jgi:hypothetical protein